MPFSKALGNCCNKIGYFSLLCSSVAYVSRSGGMSNELNNIISKATNGVFEGVAIGGDRYPGTNFMDHIMRYQKDPEVSKLFLAPLPMDDDSVSAHIHLFNGLFLLFLLSRRSRCSYCWVKSVVSKNTTYVLPCKMAALRSRWLPGVSEPVPVSCRFIKIKLSCSPPN